MGEVSDRCNVEGMLAELAGRRGAIICSRATVGLAATLRALGLERGSGVLMPVMMCANVVHAVRGAGLEPIFVDMDRRVVEVGFQIDEADAERVIKEHGNARVLLAVPLFGGGQDAAILWRLAGRHGLVVVEDLAQCGVRKAEGAIGPVAGVYSFGAGKIGDAGGGAAVISDDLALLEKVRTEGHGERLSGETIARIVDALEGMEIEIAGRYERARAYKELLSSVGGVVQPGGELPVWKYSLLLGNRAERDHATRRLLAGGVQASNLYAPLSRWFGNANSKGVKSDDAFPVASDIWRRIVNLPLRPRREGVAEDVLRVLAGGDDG